MKGRKVFDVFLNKSEIKIFINNKIRSKNTHGTGCVYQVRLQLILRAEK